MVIVSVNWVYASESCIMCSMDARKSETKIIVQIINGTRDIANGKYSLCSLHCLFVLKKNLPGDATGAILIRDYANVSGGDPTGEMIDAKKAYYLMESALRPKGSMPPFTLAFSTSATAESFKKAYGGKIMNWDELSAYMENR